MSGGIPAEVVEPSIDPLSREASPLARQLVWAAIVMLFGGLIWFVLGLTAFEGRVFGSAIGLITIGLLGLMFSPKAENTLVAIILMLMVFLPVYGVLNRLAFGSSVPGINVWVQQLNLCLTFAGGAIAARAASHLSLSTGVFLKLEGTPKFLVNGFTAGVATAVTAMLAYASMEFVISQMDSPTLLAGGVPQWLIKLAMPIGFLVMAVRLAWTGNDRFSGRIVSMSFVGLAVLLAYVPAGERSFVVWAGAVVLLAAIAFGAPLFTAMGGMAMLLFYGAPIPISIAAVPLETSSIVSDPTLASLPLFTFAGYLLAEGGSSKRLVHLFQVAFGWLPGGVAAAAVLVCAFFTTFTGASGVTILALGGLLLPALLEAGYKEKFAVGLIAAAGSIGLLFPPSLPVILYGVASKVPIPDLFLGGLIPGALLVFLLVLMSVVSALRTQGLKGWMTSDKPLGELVVTRCADISVALWRSKFEVLLPVFVLVGFFGGYVTIFEAAAFTAFYALLIEVVIHRDLHPFRDLPDVLVESAKLMGGVLIILGVALGFTNYLVDAEVPLMVRDWVAANIGNKILFLLMLNILLLLVGALMDIYSAIIVVVPLIIPVSAVFGIHPVHLGILFLANLELGYLTPPVGLNLFLSSYRFKIPLTRVYSYALPFLAVMTFGVLLIAYVPIMTTWGLDDSTGETPDFFEDDALETQPAAPNPMDIDPAELQRMLQDDDDALETQPAAPNPMNIDPAELQRMLEDDDE